MEKIYNDILLNIFKQVFGKKYKYIDDVFIKKEDKIRNF